MKRRSVTRPWNHADALAVTRGVPDVTIWESWSAEAPGYAINQTFVGYEKTTGKVTATMLRRWWERRNALKTLRALPLFAGCSRVQLRAIDGLLAEVRVPAGRELIRQGERGLDFAIVVDGRAQVLRDREPVAELGRGAFFGEIALVDAGPRTATVVARTPMRLYVLHRVEFERLLELAPSIREQVVATADQRRELPDEPRPTRRAA